MAKMYGGRKNGDHQGRKRPRRGGGGGGGGGVSWVSLPDELWQRILSKLPVKSVIRCKCVRKSWCAFLSTPQFINLHFTEASRAARLTSNPDILFIDSCRNEENERTWQHLCLFEEFGANDEEEDVRFLSLPSHLHSLSYNLVGSCNGLFCIVFNRKGSSNNREIVYVCNPCTGESTQLVYHCGRSNHTYYGFGHDAVRDCYKVLVIAEYRGRLVGEVWVLGSSSSWTSVGEVPFIPYSYSSMNGVHYWFSRPTVGTELLGIGSFHVVNEEFEFVPLPSETFSIKDCYDLELGVLEGRMSLANLTSRDRVEIWVTDDYQQGSWTRRHVLHWPEETFARQFIMLADWDVLINHKDKLDSYDLGLIWVSGVFEATVHVGTLVSPLRGNRLHPKRKKCTSRLKK